MVSKFDFLELKKIEFLLDLLKEKKKESTMLSKLFLTCLVYVLLMIEMTKLN